MQKNIRAVNCYIKQTNNIQQIIINNKHIFYVMYVIYAKSCYIKTIFNLKLKNFKSKI